MDTQQDAIYGYGEFDLAASIHFRASDIRISDMRGRNSVVGPCVCLMTNNLGATRAHEIVRMVWLVCYTG